MRRWLVRISGLLLAWGLVVGYGVLTGRGPHIWLLLAAVFGAAGVFWIAADLSEWQGAIRWRISPRFATRTTGFDARFSRLSQRLANSPDAEVVAGEVHASLGRIADDLLASRYGVDRTQDPDAAAELLGPELSAYLDQPPKRRIARTPARIHELLDRLEAL